MSEINGIKCDICGKFLDEDDEQFRIMFPKKKKRILILFGYPRSSCGMKRLDLCKECGTELQEQIKEKVEKARSESIN